MKAQFASSIPSVPVHEKNVFAVKFKFVL